MQPNFTSDFFAGNRHRLRELFTGTAPIVLTANGLLQRGADSTYAFAQDANFWYLAGIDEPDILLVMDQDKEYLVVPGRSASREAFDGHVNYDALKKQSGVNDIVDSEEGWSRLGARLKKVKHAATLGVPSPYIEQYGMYTNPARGALVAKLKTYNSDLELLDVNQHLAYLRMIKQPQELAALQQAIDITAASIKEAAKPAKLKKYAYEYELEAELARGFRKRGASGHAFEPIVAGGKNACTLHNVANNDPLSADELIIMDVGAEVNHYAADITRTISLNGQPSPRQQAVHAAVLEVHAYALSLLKPGTLMREYEKQVTEFMGQKLQDLGLIKDNSQEEVRKFYPHATSHFLGLNVHDIGDYEKPLEPGVVITVEPGIYIPKESIGIRIEDDVLVTPKGTKILSAKLPRGLTLS